MKSVKTGRVLKEVAGAGVDLWVPREEEREREWEGEDEGELAKLEEGLFEGV